jgi:hypothetical protein
MDAVNTITYTRAKETEHEVSHNIKSNPCQYEACSDVDVTYIRIGTYHGDGGREAW